MNDKEIAKLIGEPYNSEMKKDKWTFSLTNDYEIRYKRINFTFLSIYIDIGRVIISILGFNFIWEKGFK